MKHRFTLSRQNAELVLTVMPWKVQDVSPACRGILTVQMVEDFLPADYFITRVAEALGVEPLGGDQDALVRFVWPYSDALADDIIDKLNRLASPERYGPVASDYTGLIGRTPLLKLGPLAENCAATVLVKLECMEPNSVKDRPVYNIVRQAIKRGEISPETEVVEASSGNVAFALSAILKALMDHKPRIFISKMHGPVKARAVRVSGAPVMLTSSAEGTASAKRASVQYAEERGDVFQLNQHGNPDNPRAHLMTTGPELYHQCHLLTGQPPAEFVTGLGSGGTAIGVAMFRDEIEAPFKVVGVEPEEASLLTGGTFHAHRFSGLAPGFMTDIVREGRDRLDIIETIGWREGFDVCRRMLVEEGILVGATTGASIGVALRRARMPENAGKVIVTIAHDRGDRYLEIDDLYTPPETAVEEDLENQHEGIRKP